MVLALSLSPNFKQQIKAYNRSSNTSYWEDLKKITDNEAQNQNPDQIFLK